ncbi:Rieske (2Fe-2S) protein [Streptomyces sp. NPDC015032]|uniref:Rieske (2Fe-2S) protein n=1 Tax=Streptomyces sp. NPDC015032 TaxID=3364937 RepID=UPI0036FF4320
MNASQDHGVRPGRRAVVTAVGAVSVTAVLTACGGQKDSDGPEAVEAAAAGRGGGADVPAKTTDIPEGGGRDVLAKTTDIPEGGGKIFADRGIVVTQPAAGSFKAFSSKCTHQGCAVSSVSGGTINCACHNSRFDLATGDVTAGPATRPLAAEAIKVKGDSITLPA